MPNAELGSRLGDLALSHSSMVNRHVRNGPMTGHTAEAAKSTRLTRCGPRGLVGTYFIIADSQPYWELHRKIASPCLDQFNPAWFSLPRSPALSDSCR